MNKLLIILRGAIDWFGKSISRLKNIAILVIIIFFIISLVNNGCERKRAEQLFEKVTGLDLQNDILHRNISLMDTIISEKDEYILELEARDIILCDSISILRADYGDMADQKNKIISDLLNVPADTSYKFLNETVYPFPGNQKYRFNEPQIKNIHLDYLENTLLTNMNINLMGQVKTCEDRLVIRDEVTYSLKSQVSAYEEEKSNYDEIIYNKDEIIDYQEGVIGKDKRRGKLWKILAGVGTVLGIVIGSSL